MGLLDKLKDAKDAVEDKMDDLITGKDDAEEAAEKAADKVEDAVDDAKDAVADKVDDAKDAVEDAVDEGKDKISDAVKALDLDSLDMDGLQNLLKGKETDLDSIAADIGKKVLEGDTSSGSFDLSSIKDLLGKAGEIKEAISAITSKIGSLKG